MPGHLLTVEHLSIRHGERVIVNDLSFSIDPGEIIAMTGGSGSGKTSIAYAILEMLPAGLVATGDLKWEDRLPWRDKSSNWAALRGTEISFIPQDVYGTFDPIMRMGKQMAEIVKDRKGSANELIEQQLKKAMEEVGLRDIERLWQSYPHQLSGGQLQRCQICIAIALQPKLLIADEPTSALDKVSQLELLDVFAMLRQQYQMAILFITHESSVVTYLADREISLSSMVDKNDFIEKDTVPTSPGNVIGSVSQLTYVHQYGGLLRKQGSQIGPIDFRLLAQQCLGIMGESGSGKSTIAQLLVGLLTPKEGVIQIQGSIIDLTIAGAIQLLRWKVQLVMQDGRGSLHPNFTVRETLQEVIDNRLRHGKTTTLSVDEVMLEVQLDKMLLDSKPGTLSGGECLRVSLARALLMETTIMICDESTSALDEGTRDSILHLLKKLMRDRHLALIFISHDSQLMRLVADHIIVMDQGKIVESDTADRVLHSPTHEKTRKIVAANATLAGKMTPL
jgi:ABC-type glutathione transport system ATPase component